MLEASGREGSTSRSGRFILGKGSMYLLDRRLVRPPEPLWLFGDKNYVSTQTFFVTGVFIQRKQPFT
jgi:hypothetical protein